MCRFLARKRHGQQPLSTRELATISGLSPAGVSKLSKLVTWNTVGMETAHRFSLACGVNLLSTSRHREFVRYRKLAYQRQLTPAQRRLYARLTELLSSRKQSSAGAVVQARSGFARQ